MEKSKTLKSLEVFSKKCDGPIKFSVGNKKLALAAITAETASLSWLDRGWSNGTTWQDRGWSNGSTWIDRGWSNGSSWTDRGWSNGSSWSDSGWSNSGGSGCFITTACVEHMGLTDDCEQLTILRLFRDKLVEEDPVFREQVLEYYRNAPRIVQKIMESNDKDLILDSLYHELVEPCVQLLKTEQNEAAKNHYVSVYKKLAKKYIAEQKH